MKFKGTIATEITWLRALSENPTHVTDRQLGEVSWPGDIDEMLIYKFNVLLISLNILIQLPDSTIKRMNK